MRFIDEFCKFTIVKIYDNRFNFSPVTSYVWPGRQTGIRKDPQGYER